MDISQDRRNAVVCCSSERRLGSTFEFFSSSLEVQGTRYVDWLGLSPPVRLAETVNQQQSFCDSARLACSQFSFTDSAVMSKASQQGLARDLISLIHQPAHSPELNPTEHIWEEIREKYLHNIAFSSLYQFEQTLFVALNELEKDPTRLTSLTNFPYMKITHMNAT